MTFQAMPRRLQAYILLNFLVLWPLLFLLSREPAPTNWVLVGGLLLLVILCSTWKVELTIGQAKMTLAFSVACLTLLLQGVQAATLCAMVGAAVGTYLRPEPQRRKLQVVRPPFHRTLFNIANCGISCILSALAYNAVNASWVDNDLERILSLGIFTGAYFLTNTVGISLAISLQQGIDWKKVWNQNFLWTAPGFFASASVAALVQFLFYRIGVWSLVLVPWVYLIYHSYRLYMERLKQDMSHIQELNQLNQAIIASLATAIDAKDRYTCSHIERVQHYAVSLAEAAGVSGPELEAVRTGALVHDIGKLGIPDHILGKPGKLTPEEFQRIQSHVTIGAEILSPVPFPFPVVDVVLTHHERWDGLGYPRGLRGEEIPVGGRIIAIVDVFDALTSNRPYRRAMTMEEANTILQEGAGKQFDPRLVELFIHILPEVQQHITRLEQEEQARLAAAASEANENGSALIRISQAAAEMAAVCDVAHSLAEQETLEEVCQVVVHRALSLLPADTAVLYLRAEGNSILQAVATEGRYRQRLERMTIQVGEGVSGWVAEHQQPKVNVSASLDIARRFGPEENIELSAATAVPLMQGSTTLGVLCVYTMGYSVLSAHHLHVLNILAEHAAAAIQNCRRIERNQALAYTDALTGLANSRCLIRHLDRLTHAARQSEGVDFSIVMLDLDRFKEVNDRLGHLRGDDLLREVARILTAAARPGDLVCRYAGDEFVVVLAAAGREQAEPVAERIRREIDEMPQVDGLVKVGSSVGVASFPEDGADGRTLISVADTRMYEDKFERRSRNQWPGSRGAARLLQT